MTSPISLSAQTPSIVSMAVGAQTVCPPAYTRARRTDSDTSHQAAKFAATRKAESERLAIYRAIHDRGPLTAREVSAAIGLDYIEVQRRISEVAGLTKTKETRDGCKVWGLA